MDLEDFNDDILNDDLLVELSEAAENNQLPEQHSKPEKEPGPEHLEVLSRYFGHTSFRPMQWEIISAILEDHRDVCAIMCTGYGKSLCFQFPSTFTGGVTLVISPLIALMEDQVLALQVANIPACLLGTAQKNQTKVIADIFKKKYSLVYLTPEFCTGDMGSEMLRKMNNELSVTLIAVDEAHCISSWGHDFRFSYRKLGCLHYIFPNVPIIAVTATATKKVQEDIITNLKLRNPLLLCSGFNRPNLYFEVHHKVENAIFQDLTKAMVYKDSTWKFSGPTIVYCITRKQTEEISNILRDHGINSRPYHAGLSLKIREETHHQFVRDQIDVVVATIAFGMGIDKPDIANIVHYGASKSIENYYQEVGRAGRDGNPGRCVAFYCDFDFWLLRKIEENSRGNAEQKEANIEMMEKYMSFRQCRRRFILDYFDDAAPKPDGPQPNCCDNCTTKRYDYRPDYEKFEGLDEQGRFDFTSDVRLILEAVTNLGTGYGYTTYCSFLKGSNNSRTSSICNHPMFGLAKHRTDAWLKAVVKLLVQEDYLDEVPEETVDGYSYNSLALTPQGNILLSQIKNEEIKFLRPPPENVRKLLKTKLHKKSTPKLNRPSTSKSEEPESPEDIEQKMKLYQQLINKRTELATELECMPYMVASNTALMSLARYKPETIHGMRALNLDGFTEAKLNKFGECFLKIINIARANDKTNQKPRPIEDIINRYPLSGNSFNFSAGVSCSLMESGLNPEDIAAKRKLALSTVKGHLIAGLKAGKRIKLSEFGISKEIRDAVVKIFKKYYNPTVGFKGISTKIKMEGPGTITFDHINAVLSYLEVRYHLQKLKVPYEEFEDFQFNEIINTVLNNNETIPKANEDKENLNISDIPEIGDFYEPPTKKEKINSDNVCYSILDSPPHTLTFEDDKGVCEEIVIVEDDVDLSVKVPEVKSPGKKAKNKQALPPWLVTKKVN